MIFGEVPVAEAEGAILAHSLRAGGRTIKKGTRLEADQLFALASAGISTITVARLGEEDVAEDEAAAMIGERLLADGLRLGPAFTGRANILADGDGIVTADAARIDALNAIDEGMTLATLPPVSRVHADQLVATVKVIPYALPRGVVSAGLEALGKGTLGFHPFLGGTARLILTRVDGMKESLLDKGEEVVRARVEALGYALSPAVTIAHETGAVARALGGDGAELTLILGASATSDRRDVAPQAVIDAGGEIVRFGMPVDPGNLLFLGDLDGSPVVGLPGCARSPALNGVDWVLERLAAGLPVGGEDIAAMGVGGLLKEMQGRPQPRNG